jgi:carbon-monoxide dehydrogenase medium subunit
VKPAPFKYIAAESLDEAIQVLREHGDEAKVLAGGQSLVPLMNLRLAMPRVLVDLNRLAELQGISANGILEVGAMTRQIVVERSADIRTNAPLVSEALRYVAFPGVRSRGTIGGSLAHADPAAESPAVLLALSGEVVARGPSGDRTISADELFVTYFTTALAPDEVLTHVRIPRRGDGQRFGFEEVARKQSDFALAGAAVAVELDAEGVCGSARIALFGVADRPVRSTAAEQALAGRKLDAGAAAEAAAIVQAELEPTSDSHASAAYRKDVAAVVVRRALLQAAGEGGAR